MQMEFPVLHPAYFPSIAHFVVLATHPTVVFEACDNFQKQTYRNRTHIAHSNGILKLFVPIKHHKGPRQKTKDVYLDYSEQWQAQHWKSLQAAYRTSPFFEFYEDEIAPLFKLKSTTLWEHNLVIINTLCNLIGVETPKKLTTHYQADHTYDYRFLIDAKTEPCYNFLPYLQVFNQMHGFLENLSVLDLIFNEGPNTLQYLEMQSKHLLPTNQL